MFYVEAKIFILQYYTLFLWLNARSDRKYCDLHIG